MWKRAYPLVIVIAAVGAQLHGADWPCWRGPQYDGINRETGVTLPWKESPKAVWEAALGPAFSGISVVGDLVYTCGTEEDEQVLFCLKAENGDVVWKKTFAGSVKDKMGGDGTRATPTVDGGKVYIFGGEGTLLCADAKSGREVWTKKFKKPPHWKYAGSVLIEENLAVVSPGGDDGGLVALDKNTGEIVWAGGDDQASYATPYPFTFEGRRYIAGMLAKTMVIVDAKTGGEVYSMPWETKYDVNASTPIYHDGHLFTSSGYGHGAILLRLKTDGDRLAATTVWESKAILNKMHTCTLLDGKLYGADEKKLKCVDFLTGEEVWSVDRIADEKTQYATLVLNGGHFIYLGEKGHLAAAKASAEGFEAVGVTPVLSGRCWTVPTLSGGRLYVRNLEKLVCLEFGE